MKSLKNNKGSGGVGFLGLLTILFVALKLTSVINWSWWAVTSPMWGGALFMVAMVIATVLLASASRK